jgi:mono/diheme cytochrome c family protein
MKALLAAQFILFMTLSAFATDWQRDFTLPGEGRFTTETRANILELPAERWTQALARGRRHVFSYPVTVTELTIPYRAFMGFFEERANNPLKRWIQTLTRGVVPFKSPGEVMGWLGVHPFPSDDTTPVSAEERALGMGASVLEMEGAKGLTFSCAACHTAELFGRPVVGLTNRFPRANEFFTHGQNLLPLADPRLFQMLTRATPAERALLERARHAVTFVGAKKPAALGLDTSLAQVALSLAKRGTDEYAARLAQTARRPRPNPLSREVADSKPAVWWNVKYKTRWLSDGSIVQGNPILTNFLWNEIGRGVDLKNLEDWIAENRDTIDDLTAAVFATQAPAYLDFLPAESFDLALAKAGQAPYEATCMRCHGRYEKGWEAPDAEQLSVKAQARTVRVHYHRKTPVIDVGTDPGRHRGMRHFAGPLNRLAISRAIETIVEPQQGYVPPPLVGIWARWPYFHNNSAPSLCAVLTRAAERPVRYVSGPAVNPATDYDAECGGYPELAKAPAAWRARSEHVFDTRKPGLGNGGHDEGIFLREGREVLTPTQKRAIIEFLKTL